MIYIKNDSTYTFEKVEDLETLGFSKEEAKAIFFDASKTQKIEQINKKFDLFIKTKLFAGYPDAEQSTFNRQVELADAYFADTSASHDTLTGLAEEHSTDVASIAQKIKDKQAFSEPHIFRAMGKKQSLIKSIELLTLGDGKTVDDIHAIIWIDPVIN